MNQSSLLVRLPNWVGDVVMTLPALSILHAHGITPTLIGKPWAQSLLAALNLPWIPLKPSLYSMVQTLRQPQLPEKSLLFTNGLSSALMMRLSTHPCMGYAGHARRWLLHKALAKQTHRHEVEAFGDLATTVIETWFSSNTAASLLPTRLHLPLTTTAQQAAQQQLTAHQVSEPFWVLCPFAHGQGAQHQSKQWPHWEALIHALAPRPLIICPGPQEILSIPTRSSSVKILKHIDLPTYAAILSRAERVIANDSGPMHLATAVGTKTLGLFGATDPHRTRPWGGEYLGALGQWPTLENVMQWCETHRD